MRVKIALLAALVLVGCQAPLGESTTEQATILTPPNFDFGGLQVGSTSPVHLVTVSPALGNQSDQITAITESCPDFEVKATGLPATVFRVCEVLCAVQPCPVTAPDEPAAQAQAICTTTDYQDYTFETYFKPTVAGTVSCAVTVTTANAANSRTFTLTGTGTVPDYRIDVQPGSVAFGDVRVGAASTQATITVTSTGSQVLFVASASTSAGFSIVSEPTGSYQLTPNSSRSYAVTCNPTAMGALSGAFTVMSNDPVRPTVTVPLTCRGIDSALDITPSPLALATTRVGEPREATITLKNSGTAPMVLSSIALNAAGSGITMVSSPALPLTLAASGTAAVRVKFDAATKGDASATLSATFDGGKSRSAQISARALATSMALTPDGEVDFGPVCGGQTKTQEFTLIGNEQGSFVLSSVGGVTAPFSITAPTLPVTVQGAGASQVKFQVTATPVEPGAATSQLALKTDIPGATDRVLTLKVDGLPAGVTATPASIDLGSNPLNSTTIGQPVNLTNCGAAPITFSNPRIEGPDALDFAIVAQPSAAMLQPATSASWLVVLQPHSVGVKQASFVVDYDGGSASVTLDGEGLGDKLVPPGDDRGSYYACSTGQPLALWPVLIALGLVLRRRSRR